MEACLAREQRTIWDLRDAAGRPLFEQPGVVRPFEPQSARVLTDGLTRGGDPFADLGTQVSGRQREVMQDEVGDALIEFYCAAKALDGEVGAAEMLLNLCARDPLFHPPQWLHDLWDDYRAELYAAFHGSADDRTTDWGEGREEGDDDE